MFTPSESGRPTRQPETCGEQRVGDAKTEFDQCGFSSPWPSDQSTRDRPRKRTINRSRTACVRSGESPCAKFSAAASCVVCWTTAWRSSGSIRGFIDWPPNDESPLYSKRAIQGKTGREFSKKLEKSPFASDRLSIGSPSFAPLGCGVPPEFTSHRVAFEYPLKATPATV
jgi:hypothetical protein